MKTLLTYKFLLPVAAMWLLWSGCESSLEFPQEGFTKLTIVSHLSPSSWQGQRVYVYTSQSPADSSRFYTPANLDVTVYELESDALIHLDSFKDGRLNFFGFPQGFLKAGKTYSITASAPGFEPVHATTKIPHPSTIENLVVKDMIIEPSQKNEEKEIIRYKLQFNINHAEENRYYHLVFYNQYKDVIPLGIIDPELSDNQPFVYHYDFGILIDKEDLAPGEPLTFHFVDWMVEQEEILRVYVELRSITEEYFKYHTTLARQLIVRQDPFAEPVTIFNNIEGGYGNFSGFVPDVTSSSLPE